jgi:hypothetical protein
MLVKGRVPLPSLKVKELLGATHPHSLSVLPGPAWVGLLLKWVDSPF